MESPSKESKKSSRKSKSKKKDKKKKHKKKHKRSKSGKVSASQLPANPLLEPSSSQLSVKTRRQADRFDFVD